MLWKMCFKKEKISLNILKWRLVVTSVNIFISASAGSTDMQPPNIHNSMDQISEKYLLPIQFCNVVHSNHKLLR